MKKIFRLLSVLMIAVMSVTAVSVTSSAESSGSASDAKEGVVYIESYFTSGEHIFNFGTSAEPYFTFATTAMRGSGFAIGEGTETEYIVTNAHVVLDDTAECARAGSPLSQSLSASSQKANEVRVYFSYAANDFMRAQIYIVDEDKDICVLKLPEKTDKRKPLVLCKSDNIDEDDTFSALGFPFDSDIAVDETSQSYDINDITTTRGAISRHNTDFNGVNVYQIDMAIAGGNSGGPLVNSRGEVVGINTYSVGDRNYAIVIDELLGLINRDIVPYMLSEDVSYAGGEESDEEAAEEQAAAEEAAAPVATSGSESETDSEGGSSNTTLVIIIAAAVAVVIVVAAVAVGYKKKKSSAGRRSSGASSNGVIVGMKGIMANRSFNINGSIVIGRNAQKCVVCFPVDTKGVSGVHCQIKQVSGGYEIMDCGSSNGTFLGNGQRLTPNVPVFIPDGTYFYLGSAEQLFQIKY